MDGLSQARLCGRLPLHLFRTDTGNRIEDPPTANDREGQPAVTASVRQE
jgi:hypothetical protein